MPVVPYPDPDTAGPSPEAAAATATGGANELMSLARLLSHPTVGYASITGHVAAGIVPGFSLADHYLSVFDKGAKDISAKMGLASRSMFDRAAADVRSTLASGLAAHEAEQGRVLRSRALNELVSKITGALVAGAGDDDGYAGQARAALKADGLAKGLSGEALDARTAHDFGRRVVVPVVTARLREGKVSEARTFFDAHREGMAEGDAGTLEGKIKGAEAPAGLDESGFAVVARAVGIDPAPNGLDAEAQARLGILRAHVDAAITAARANGEKLSPEDTMRVALSAAARAVNAHPVLGVSKRVQRVLDVKPDALKTPEPKPRRAKPQSVPGVIFDRMEPEKFQYPGFRADGGQLETHARTDLHLPNLADIVKSLSEVPVSPGGYTHVVDGRVYIELSTPTGNRIVRDPQDLALEIRQRKALETLDELESSPLGAGAYGAANLLHADPDTQQLALDMGTSVDGMAMGFADVDPYRGGRPGRLKAGSSRENKYETPAERGLPRGFADATRLTRFGKTLHQGLADVGFGDTRAILQGSGVTGQKFKGGAPFDFGRVSDFDIALTGNDIFEMAKAKGIPLWSGKKRTGPLRRRDLEALGLADIAAELTRQAGRPVHFMIYQDRDTAVRRGISFEISKDEGDN